MAPILGVLFAILVGLLSVPSLISWQSQANNNVNAASIAQQARQIVQASSQYIQTNATTLQATATTSTPVTVSVAQLQAAGVLPGAFKTTNLYNQAWQLQVLQPTPGNLQGLVITTGGEAISDTRAMQVAKLIGYEGGFFPKNDTGLYPGGASNAHGASWGPLSAAGYTNEAGHIALLISFNSGQLNDNRLYRNAVPGQPQLNTMTTPLIMASTQVVGWACPTKGAIARDAAGTVLSCQNFKWEPGASGLHWKGSVANIASLPASGSSGDAYRITSLANHVFVWDAQNNLWQGLVVDSAGALSLPGMVYTAGSSSSYGSITMQGSRNGYSGINFKDSAGSNAGTLMMSPTYSGFFNAADGAWRWYVDNNGNSIQPGSIDAGGAIKVGANNQILGRGSIGTYGATTIAGEKGGWTGVEFRSSAGAYQVNQMTNRGQTGYYDAATGRWLEYVDTAGNKTLDQTADWNSGRLNLGWAVETWGCTTGQIAKAAYTITEGWAYNGKTLMCVNDVWTQVKGTQGPAGAQGPQGQQGPQGPQGPAGPSTGFNLYNGAPCLHPSNGYGLQASGTVITVYISSPSGGSASEKKMICAAGMWVGY